MPVGMFLSSLDQSPLCIWYRAHGKWFQIDGKTYVSGNLDVMAIFFATFSPLNSIKDKITLSADRKLEWPFCSLMHKRCPVLIKLPLLQHKQLCSRPLFFFFFKCNHWQLLSCCLTIWGTLTGYGIYYLFTWKLFLIEDDMDFELDLYLHAK